MIGFYNYTVILTYISLLISATGIFLADAGHPYGALFCLLASGVCDMFDGKIARTRKQSTAEERLFGIQLDALCDIVCFGVLPAYIGVTLTPAGDFPVIAIISRISGALFILCALIRLAYFNVTEETRQAGGEGKRTHYLGVPVTTAAVIFPLVYVLTKVLPAVIAPWVYPLFLIATAVSFITPVRIRKPYGAGLVILGVIGLAELGLLVYLLAR